MPPEPSPQYDRTLASTQDFAPAVVAAIHGEPPEGIRDSFNLSQGLELDWMP